MLGDDVQPGIGQEMVNIGDAAGHRVFDRDHAERASITRNRTRLFVGSPATVMQKLQPMIDASKPDELMVISAIYDHEARKKSYTLLADAYGLEKQAAA